MVLGPAGFAHSPPLVKTGVGFRTAFGTVLPPGGNVVAYVRSTGPQAYDDQDVVANMVTTLNAGLIRARSGRGDIVVVLPEHAENISAIDQMSNLVAGTRILGCGYGTMRPTFTWTANAATFLFDVANVALDNCILNMDSGAGTGGSPIAVAAPITISAAGCSITNCLMRTSTDANNLSTIPIAATDAADDLTFVGNRMFGATAGECTTMLSFLGTDRLVMMDCYLEGATSAAAVGLLKFAATAATKIVIRRCAFVNRKASSSQAVTGVAGLNGVIEDCSFGVLDDATKAPLVTPGNMMGFRNRMVNLTGEQGAEATVQST